MKTYGHYLNVGCGKKFHPDWENIDLVSTSKYVRAHDLTKGFPYKDNSFDVLYHNQVMEHIPKEDAPAFAKECLRVLKPNGIMRAIMPDLENIIDEYRRLLDVNTTNPTPQSKADYEWVMIELFDQVIRNKTGGLMVPYLLQNNMINEKYVEGRFGALRNHVKSRAGRKESLSTRLKRTYSDRGLTKFVSSVLTMAKDKFLNTVVGEKYSVGNFRLGGEIHYWMYDRFSLSELLKDVGFKDVKVMTPQTSDIPDWEKFELDIRDGVVLEPTSLFVEARK